ncbi:hypothetical protein ACFXNW_21985 [Nocardia sp. NPDC059180]
MALHSKNPMEQWAPAVFAQARLMAGIASVELESGRLQDGR